MRVPVAFHSYRHGSLSISAQRVINRFAETQARDAKSQVVLLPTPGVVRAFTLPNGPVRGLHAMGDRLFAVAQRRVYRMELNGTADDVGQIDAGGAVSMSDNGTHVVIVVPETGSAWLIGRTGNVTAITDADYLDSVMVDVLDGFAAFVRKDSNEFFLSQPNDAATFDALDFASAEGSPDNLVAIKRVGRELWLLGERTTEIWANVGAADFPFLRVSGAFVERGCAASFSVAAAFGTIFWLGDDRAIYTARGFQPERISTHPIEQAFLRYADVSGARGWCYEQEGHQFYILTVPGTGTTWVFDTKTAVWHERESEGYSGWRCVVGTNWAGGVFAGDAISGTIWRVDPLAYDEDGEPIRRVATGRPMHAEGKSLFFSRFELDAEVGVGNLVAPGDNPKVWLDYSDDGGFTWNGGLERQMGPRGRYNRRIEWRRLGSARNRVFRVSDAATVRTALIAANIEVKAGA